MFFLGGENTGEVKCRCKNDRLEEADTMGREERRGRREGGKEGRREDVP